MHTTPDEGGRWRTYAAGVDQLVRLMQEAAAEAIEAGACRLERDDAASPGPAPRGAKLIPANNKSCSVHLMLDDVAWPGSVFLVIGNDNPGYEVWAKGAGYDTRTNDWSDEALENYVRILRRILDAVIRGRVRDWVDSENPNRVITVLELVTDQGGLEEWISSRNVWFVRRLLKKVTLRHYEPYIP